MNYGILRKNTNVGRNTRNTGNVLSYSHLPEGFTFNLCIKDYSCNYVLRESLGRSAPPYSNGSVGFQITELQKKAAFAGALTHTGLESGLDNSPMYDNTSFDEIVNMMMLAYIALLMKKINKKYF